MERVYRTSTGFKVGCWILAVICAVFIVLVPGTILMLWLAYKAEVRMTNDKLYVRWMGTREIPWKDLSGFEWARAAGIIGAMMRPLSYSLNGKSGGNIAIGAFEKNDEILAELATRSGQKIPG